MQRVEAAHEAAAVPFELRFFEYKPRAARGQRLRNAQPGGRLSSAGVMPGICASGEPRRLRLGTEPIRPWV